MADLGLTLNGLWELQSSALSAPDTVSQQVHYLDKQGNMGRIREIHELAVGQVKMFLQFVNKPLTNWRQTPTQLHESHSEFRVKIYMLATSPRRELESKTYKLYLSFIWLPCHSLS